MFRSSTHTFDYPEVSTPVVAAPVSLTIADPLSWLEGPRGSGHPDPDFKFPWPQHNQQPCNRSTSRRNIPCHGVHDSNR
jgi:hypothetical protein